MATQEYKIKVEYGVSAIVLLIGVFFIFQAFEISTARAPPTPPLRRRAGDGGLNPPPPIRHFPRGNFTAPEADAPTLCDAPSQAAGS